MKLFKSLEKSIRNQRNRFFRKMFSRDFWKKIHLEGMSDNVLFITKQLKDHRLTFIPKEWIGSSIYKKGHYKRDIFEKIISLLKKHELVNNKKNVIELGANIGTHTIYMHLSKYFDHIFCVEADPENTKVLIQNLEQNNFLKNSTVISKAINSYDGSVKLFKTINEFNLGYQSIINIENSDKYIDVKCNTLSSIFSINKIDKQKIGFFWIDLEGIEFNVIKQINSLVGYDIPILTEFSPYIYGEKKTQEFVLYLQEKYSYCYVIKEKLERLVKFCDNQKLDINFDQADLLLFN